MKSARQNAQHNAHAATLRHALLRLGASDASGRPATDVALPPLLRAPAIALLWVALLFLATGLLALGRVRVPRIARGVVVAVRLAPDSGALMLLLPAAARPHVQAGQTALLDVGEERPLTLGLTDVEPSLLDAATARARFARHVGLIAHLETPKLVVRVASCGRAGCLTPSFGAVYAASVPLGTRTLASYAWSGAPLPSR